jgi:hypothetical protein
VHPVLVLSINGVAAVATPFLISLKNFDYRSFMMPEEIMAKGYEPKRC